MSSPSFSHSASGMHHSGNFNSGSLSGGRAIGSNSISGMHHSGSLNSGQHHSAINQSIVRNGSHGVSSTNHQVMHQGTAAMSGNHGLTQNGAGNHNHLTSLTGTHNHAVNGQHSNSFLGKHSGHHTGANGNLHHVGNNVGNNLAHHNGNWNHNHNGNFNHHHFNNNFGFFPFWLGYNNWGWNRWNRYPFWGFGFPFWGYPYYLGLYGYGGYGYGYGYGAGYYSYNPYCVYGSYIYPTDGIVQGSPAVNQTTDAPAEGQVGEFAIAGENDFRQGNYQSAVRDLRHAMLDDPNNGTLLLLMSQALFATGAYDEAAGAVQQAMQMLPEDQWGVVVSNYRELYPKVGNYTDQLRALEKQMKDKPESPALRFLAGYHYGYLGYPTDAFKQLEKVKALAPQDEMAKKLLEIMATRAAGGDTNAKPTPKEPEKPVTKADALD